MHWQFQRERAKSILGISSITYVTARPKSLGIVVLQFHSGHFQLKMVWKKPENQLFPLQISTIVPC